MPLNLPLHDRSATSRSDIRLRSADGKVLRIALLGTPGDGATCYVRVTGLGPRGRKIKTALYVSTNAPMLESFYDRAAQIIDAGTGRESVSFGGGSLALTSTANVATFYIRGARGAIVWEGHYGVAPLEGFASAADLLGALLRAAQHTRGT